MKSLNESPSKFMNQSNQDWTLRRAISLVVSSFFPRLLHRSQLAGLLIIGAAITLAELATIHSFSTLVGHLAKPVENTLLPLFIFLIAFVSVRFISYFHSILKIKLLEQRFADQNSYSAQTMTWIWPAGIALLTLLTAFARFAILTIQLVRTNWLFGIVLIAVFSCSWFLTTRMACKQYEIHRNFLNARNTPQAPSPSERVRTRVFAGETNSLRAFLTIPPLVLLLAYLVSQQMISDRDAILLFFALRIISSITHTISTAVTQFVRAFVYIENDLQNRSDTDEADAPHHIEQTQETAHLSTSAERGREQKEREEISNFLLGQSISLPPTQMLARWLSEGNSFKPPTFFRRQNEPEPGSEGFRQALPRQVRTSLPFQNWEISLIEADNTTVIICQDIFSSYLLPIAILDSTESIKEFRNRVFESIKGVIPDQSTHTEIGLFGGWDLLNSTLSCRQFVTKLEAARTLAWINLGKLGQSHHDLSLTLSGLRGEDVELLDWSRALAGWYNDDFYVPSRGYFTPNQIAFGDHSELVSQRANAMGEHFRHKDFAVWRCPSSVITAAPKEMVNRIFPAEEMAFASDDYEIE